MYCWVKDGQIRTYLDPHAPFSIHADGTVSRQPFLGPGGTNYPPGWLSACGDEWCAVVNIYPLVETGTRREDDFYTTFTGDSVIDGRPVRTHTPVARSLEECKRRLLTRVKDIRWQKRTGGFVWNGKTVPTDQTTLDSLTGAVALFDKDPTLTAVDWDLGSEFITLDKDAMSALAVAAGRWVQAVYTASRTIIANIEALSSVEECAAFDVNVGWP